MKLDADHCGISVGASLKPVYHNKSMAFVNHYYMKNLINGTEVDSGSRRLAGTRSSLQRSFEWSTNVNKGGYVEC